MTAERAYELFVRCFNNGDFSPLRSQARRDMHFSSVDSIYAYTMADKAIEILNTRFGSQRREQAFTGFVLEDGLLGVRRYALCALIARDTPQDIALLVRMTLKRGKIQTLRFDSPEGQTITRGRALTG